MSHSRLTRFLLVGALTIACLCSGPAAGARARAGARAPALLFAQSGILQPAAPTTTATQSGRTVLCTSRRADWERNRMAWSLFLGFIAFLATLYLLTFLRFKNTPARLIVAVAAAIFIAPAVMAGIYRSALSVCAPPPTLGYAYWMGISTWGTYLGIGGTILIILLLRYLIVRGRFRQELPAA
ncbi:MAG TPA: hypothetical protein VF546_23130 [Pyrinomonadaceae bacterium]|jgi:hypothetical protein